MLFFIDDNFFVDSDYSQRALAGIDPGKDTIWISSSTVHIADHSDMLDLAHKSGCRLLSIGIETLEGKNLKKSIRTGTTRMNIRMLLRS